MKLVTSLLLCFNSWAIVSGEYQCFQGNNNSICKQRVKVYQDELENITALKVTYIGYCEGMGSNLFYCQNNICESGYQEIEIIDDFYTWENKAYEIRCEKFKLSEVVLR